MHYRKRPILQSSLLAMMVSAGFSVPAFAQDAPAAPASPEAGEEAVTETSQAQAPTDVVSRIQVLGAQRIDPLTVLNHLPIRVGDMISEAQIDLAVRVLFRTEQFSDVQIALQPNGTLLVQVVENPVINQVVFEGNSALTEERLREELGVRPRGVYTRARVQAEVQRIVDAARQWLHLRPPGAR